MHGLPRLKMLAQSWTFRILPPFHFRLEEDQGCHKLAKAVALYFLHQAQVGKPAGKRPL